MPSAGAACMAAHRLRLTVVAACPPCALRGLNRLLLLLLVVVAVVVLPTLPPCPVQLWGACIYHR